MKGIKGFILGLIILLFCAVSKSSAQSAAIDFTVTDLGKGKVKINWKNTYVSCVQLAVQCSYDSLKFFHTILNTQSPGLPDNGFVYKNNHPDSKIYYRIFFVLNGGNYFFSRSKSISAETLPTEEPNAIISGQPEEIRIEDIPFLSRKRRVNSDIISSDNQILKKNSPTTLAKPPEKKFIHIYYHTKDSLIQTLEYPEYKNFKDSISTKTKDTLYAISRYDVILMPFVPKYVWKPSTYIFTNHNGYVAINIPDATEHHYRIVFLEEDGSLLFEIKHVKEADLILDKTNFVHAGWFKFELFEDEKLKEKNKLYLDKEF